ncbi:MAG: formylglycine-generating enzyme family protein [Planctomycetaceae bacterium]|nr:formylglycine-generating enzyme family protein [Planctomycetaceae bacterium]
MPFVSVVAPRDISRTLITSVVYLVCAAVAVAGEASPSVQGTPLAVLVAGPAVGVSGTLAHSAATFAAPKSIENSIGMELVAIPTGEFLMGSADSEEDARDDERPQHLVRITKPFWMGKYEVTQSEYEKVTGENPSWFAPTGGGAAKVAGIDALRLPVENVSWTQAAEFCRKLSERPEEKAAGRVYRLPTEAEWQYACRAGTTTRFHYGDALGAAQANINGRFPYGGAPRGPYLGRTSPVGSYEPNAFGLYDMHGNVAEMCSDWFGRTYYSESPQDDPQGPAEGADRMVMGGGWNTDAFRSRAAHRRSNATEGIAQYFGLRVVCDQEDGR